LFYAKALRRRRIALEFLSLGDSIGLTLLKDILAILKLDDLGFSPGNALLGIRGGPMITICEGALKIALCPNSRLPRP